MSTAPKIGIVSLGCPKALVDSERILTALRAEGYALSNTYEGADVVLVNTCGFLDSAREESFDAIGEALSKNGKVIVTGCLGKEEGLLRQKFPDVLSITGPQQYESVVEAVHKALPPKHDPYLDLVPPEGIRLTPRHYAYLKISEGCNNRCSFCIIPSMRGDLVSRKIGELMREAEKLASAGVKELLVISQDTSAYGLDLKYAEDTWRDKTWRTKFIDVAKALSTLGIWVRLHYVYPYPHVDEVLEVMSHEGVLPYLDIPFQHASPKVLKAMRRPAHQAKTLERIQAWRKAQPDLVIRSTFIAGFPGETEEDFQFLLDWLEEAQLDRVGCFAYEAVTGAVANELPGAVPEKVKQERRGRFMETQQKISRARLKRFKGRTLDILIDKIEDGVAVGRSYADAPEIDGLVYVSGAAAKVGDKIKAKITRSDEYDLFGECVA
ncbi:MAG: 30S ribosomal protein S12 methylthiotransferase RimO [Proteobacteria bacterium]|nr:30S ribosomal protein S12 methylthiotransferase RimO [Pseudomonadota bacterium]